jgi:hypothetical protein
MYGYETKALLTLQYTCDSMKLDLNGDGADVLKAWEMYISNDGSETKGE